MFTATVYGQRQTVKKTDSGLWYLEYLPANYHTGSEKPPVIVFLHGKGERGNSAAALNLLKRLGPPKHIENGHTMTFQSNGKNHSFVVISAQLPVSKANWDPVIVDGVVNHVLRHYRIDPDRVYLTGLSLGGGGCWYYAVSSYNKPNKIAAIAPVAGFLSESKSKKDTKFLADNKMGVWAFHNSGDKIIPLSMGKAPVDGLKSHHPVIAPRFTVYNTGGHDAWTNAYNTTHAVHSPNLYEWLLLHRRGKAPAHPPAALENQVPIARAGADQQIQLPKNYTVLDGRQSRDEDGSIAKYFWKKLSGPAATIERAAASYTKISNLQQGTYVFELTVTDAQGVAAKDELVLQVGRTVVADNKEEEDDTEAVDGTGGEQGLHYTLYHGSWSRVAEITSGQLMKQGVVPNFTLSPRKRDSYFGFEFSGYISIQKSGSYTFYLTSDEGSKLWIGSREVVNNDGKHARQERSGSISLQAGLHPIKVLFFERSQQDILQVEYAGPGISRQIIPSQVLYTGKQQGQVADSGYPRKTAEQQTLSSAAHDAIRVNFNQLPENSAAGWNNMELAPKAGQKSMPLQDVKGRKTTVSLSLLTGWSGSNSRGYDSRSNAAVFPDKVVRSYYYTNGEESILISGLEKDKMYDFTFFASSWFQGNRTSEYSMGSQKTSLDASFNKDKVACLRNIRANAQGEVILKVNRASGAAYAFLGAMVIEPKGGSKTRLADSSKKGAGVEEVPAGEMPKENSLRVHVYPNPLQSKLLMDVSGMKGRVATIRLSDMLGQVLYTGQRAIGSHTETVELDLETLQLKPGLLLLQIDLQGQSLQVIKLMKE